MALKRDMGAGARMDPPGDRDIGDIIEPGRNNVAEQRFTGITR